MQRLLNWKMSTLLIYFVLSVFVKDIAVFALSVTSTGEVIGVNGGNATFRISYELRSGETFRRVNLAKDSTDVFEAPFTEPLSQAIMEGKFIGGYASRGSTDYSAGKTNFSITLSQVRPDDEGQYIVKVTTISKTESLNVRLVVDFLPGTPSISGAPVYVAGGARPTILTCTANLGKPQASMVWSRRIDSGAYTDVTENVTLTTTDNNDGTTNGNSILTVNLDTADVGVQFRCQVSNRQATLYAETEAVRETATVKPTGTGGGGDTIMPTGNGESGDTIMPTGNGESGATVTPTETAGGGALPGSPSISGAPTTVFGEAGPTVLTCTANLGKPQASMLWSRRIGSGAYTDITENVNTTTANNSDGTTSGTSILTVKLDAADDGAQFRCQVSNRQATLSAETGAIEVSVLPSSPYISGVPTSVFVGAGPTVLTCTANLGKPQASMLWSRRIGSGAFADITENINTTTANNSDGTTSITSILTVNLDVADDGAKFRCQVSNRQATLSAETGAIEVTDTTKPTTNGEGRGTIMPTENGEGGATVKPTGDEGGGATVTPTETGGGGVSAGCDDIPSKILLGAAFAVMAMISTTG